MTCTFNAGGVSARHFSEKNGKIGDECRLPQSCFRKQIGLGLVSLSILLTLLSSSSPAEPPGFDLKHDAVILGVAGQSLSISLNSPSFKWDSERIVGNTSPLHITGTLDDGQTLEVSYAPIAIGESSTVEAKLFLRWSQSEAVLRKWARLRLIDSQQSQVLKEVVLDRIDMKGHEVWTEGEPGKGLPELQGPQSQPIFMPGLFVGVEFPIAFNSFEEGKLKLAHRPGVRLQSGTWYESRNTIYGLTRVGEESRTFARYIALHRPKPRGFHVNYNSWWTSPSPYYTENNILELMDVIDKKLVADRGTALDSFCIDMGWSQPQSIWEIDTKSFPEGFTRLQDAARKMHSNLGLWISPSSCYPTALDSDWAQSHGYELQNRLLCLGGARYAHQFKARLSDLVSRYGINHLKLDGYAAECSQPDHGHEPADLSAEPIAEGIIAAMEAARKENPNVWLEATCFGWHASPWWLLHANSVLGAYGDDAPFGRCPAPVYRESYTTARDFFNLQGAYLLPTPVVAQEVLGIIHQTPEPFLNDAVMTVMRGHAFLPLYVNPKFMNDARWDALAELLGWARNNSDLLEETVPLLPASWQQGRIPRFTDKAVMPREPYGYAHIKNDAGLVVLRNPWLAPQSYALKLDRQLGFSDAAKNLSAESVYPEPRCYGQRLKFGDAFDVPLAPYETLVLAFNTRETAGDPQQVLSTNRNHIRVLKCQSKLQRVEFREAAAWHGPDWTCPLGDASTAIRLTCEANVHAMAPHTELLLLYEGKRAIAAPVGRLTVNGREVNVETISSDTGWAASGLPVPEHWLFVRAPLVDGDNAIFLEQFAAHDCTQVSAWLWATRPGETSTKPRSLPQPELISLDGASFLASADVARLPIETERIDRPVERIDGRFLDALEPVSVSQGWGILQKNRSVWEKPLTIGGRRFLRGLGTHAPSTIVFALDGQYRRFQAWAGADANTNPSVKFEVWADGVQKWHSEVMMRETPAAWVDVDISGAKTLKLVVGDAGDLTSDHADWAEAKLLR